MPLAKTNLPPDEQIRAMLVYDDQVASGSGMETTTGSAEDNLHSVISQINRLMSGTTAGNEWFTDTITPPAFEGGSQRGVNGLNTDLHALERKRILKRVGEVGIDVPDPGAALLSVLGAGDLPTNTTAAIGAVTTLGTVAATATTFGTAGLDEVTGSNTLTPNNLLILTDTATGSEVTRISDGKQIWGLLQTESSTDGSTITATTPNRAQISFVVHNATNDDLELIAASDMNGTVFDYAAVQRQAFADCPEEGFLGDGFQDTGTANTSRQSTYNVQGTGVITTTTSATLDIGTGFTWEIGDVASAALLIFTEGSGGGTTALAIGADVDTYDNNAVDVDFNNGITVDNGSDPIAIGIIADTIEFSGTASVTATSGNPVTLGSTAANTTVSTTTSGNVVVSSAGAVTVDGTAVSIDGTAASNFSVASADLTLETTTSGLITITGASSVNTTVNGTSRTAIGTDTEAYSFTDGTNNLLTVTRNDGSGDSVGITSFVANFTSDATAFSIDGTGASNVTVTGAALTLSTVTSGDVVVAAAADVTVDATSGISLDAAATSNFTTSAGTLTISNSSATITDDVSVTTNGGDVNVASTLGDIIHSAPAGTVSTVGANATTTVGSFSTVSVSNLDKDAATVPGVARIESSFLSVENSTEGNVVLTFGGGYNVSAGTNTYQVSVVSCSSGTADTITALTNNGAATNPTATTTGSSTFSVDQFVLLTGAAEQNNGVFKVVSHAGTTLTLDATPSAGEEFIRQQVLTEGSISAGVCLVTLSVLRVDTTGNYQIAEAFSTVAGLSYQDVGAGAITLDNAVSNQAGTGFTAGSFTTQWGLTDGFALEIGDSANAGIFTVSAASAGDSVTVDLAETAAGATFSVTDGTNTLLSVSADTGGDTVAVANVSTVDVDASGAVSLNSTGGVLNVGNDPDANAINIGTGAAARTITVGNVTGATGLDFDAGQGGITLDTATGGAISIDALAAAINVTTTTSGTISVVSASSVALTSGAGAAINNTTGAGSGAIGGEFDVTTGLGAAGFQGGLVDVNTGNGGAGGSGSDGGDGGDVSINGGFGGAAAEAVSPDAGGMGGSFQFVGGAGGISDGTNTGGNLGGDAGLGGSIQVIGGAGGAGQAGTVDPGQPAAGGQITITGGGGGVGAGTSANADGADIVLSGGAPGTGGSGAAADRGTVRLASGGDHLHEIAQLENTVQTVQLFTGSVSPSATVTGLAGSLYMRDTTGSGELWINTSSGSGTSWDQLITTVTTVTRQFFQTDVTSAVSAGSTLTSADVTGTLPTRPSSNFTWELDAQVFLNGVLLMNSTSSTTNEVDDATANATDIDIESGGPAFAIGDIVTIIYYTNST